MSDIVIVAPATSLKTGGTMNLTVEGIISSLYAPIELDVSKVTFSVTPGEATGTTVDAKTGKVTAGTTVKATYNGLEDSVQITIVK